MKPLFNIRGFYFISLLAVLLGGSSCIKIDATVSLKRDGSGTMRAMYAMPTSILKQMERTRQWVRVLDRAGGVTASPSKARRDFSLLFDETALKAEFKAMEPDGVMIEPQSLRLREHGGWEYVDFSVRFTRLESLVKQPFFKDCGVRLTHSGESSCKLVVTLPPVRDGADLTGGTDNAVKLTPFLNGMRVVVRIDCPGELRTSNSLISDRYRATWEWDYGKDVQILERLANEKMIAVFDASQVRINDFEKRAENVPVSDNKAPAK
ncbi:MAG: hypothetical protein WCO77_11640 [bacterium]